jgi:hypothetical protein
MKQTTVEWLEMQIVELEKNYAIPHKIYELCEQSKSMEKEQQRLIYEGLLQNVGTSIKQSDLPTFEQYYNQIYGK